MKECLVYWNKLMGIKKYLCLLLILASVIFPESAIICMAVVYGINENSLVMFSNERKEGNSLLTFSLPFEKDVLWNTRLWCVSAVYVVYGILLCLRNRNSVCTMCMICCIVLFAHMMCGYCLRRRGFFFLSGELGLIWMVQPLICILEERWERMLKGLEQNIPFLIGFVLLDFLLFGLDIFVWVKEKRLFIKGAYDV